MTSLFLRSSQFITGRRRSAVPESVSASSLAARITPIYGNPGTMGTGSIFSPYNRLVVPKVTRFNVGDVHERNLCAVSRGLLES